MFLLYLSKDIFKRLYSWSFNPSVSWMVVNNCRTFPIWSDFWIEHLFHFFMVLTFALLYSFLVISPLILISLREYNWFIIDIIPFSGENDRLCFWFINPQWIFWFDFIFMWMNRFYFRPIPKNIRIPLKCCIWWMG